MFKHLHRELCLYVNTAHFSEAHFTISLVDIAVYLVWYFVVKLKDIGSIGEYTEKLSDFAYI